MKPSILKAIGSFFVITSSAAGTFAQAPFTGALDWNTLDGGGGRSTSPTYSIHGTIAQLDAGKLTAANTLHIGGFWGGVRSLQQAAVDTDNDGMPDRWETKFGFDPLDPADASGDPDGDGLQNWEEFFAGTDPRDVRSTVRLKPTLQGSNLELCWNNNWFALQFATSPAGPWLDVAGTPTLANGQYCLTQPVNSPQRFYRLRLRTINNP